MMAESPRSPRKIWERKKDKEEETPMELSIGLELESWLPNVSALVPSSLRPVKEAEDLFKLVADVVSAKVSAMSPNCSAKSRLVSAEALDWGRLWTASVDASIQPTPMPLSKCDASPFPVELVSNIMKFDEADVNNFCDVCAALRSPPLRAQTNESTGLHVHVGRYFDNDKFFSLRELAAILGAYLRFEGVINDRLLPLLRRRSSYARDLRDAVAIVAGLPRRADGQQFASNSQIIVNFVFKAVARIEKLNLQDIQKPCLVKASELRKELVGDTDGGFARIGNHRVVQVGEPHYFGAWIRKDDQKMGQKKFVMIPPGMVLSRLRHDGALLWSYDASRRQLVDVVNNPRHTSCWDAISTMADNDIVECLFRPADGVDPDDEDTFRRCLLRDALLPSGRAGSYQGLLSGAESALGSPNKYFKLNISRIALPAKRATLEFRQFAGKDLGQTLVIWGWVRFVGAFVSRCCNHEDVMETLLQPHPATERDLFDFLDLHNDTMLLCWFRDVANSVLEPRQEILQVKHHFTTLFDDWLRKSRVAAVLGDESPLPPQSTTEETKNEDDELLAVKTDDYDFVLPSNTGPETLIEYQAKLPSYSNVEVEDDPHLVAVIDACDAWRAVFHAASALKAVVPGDDTKVWGRFSSSASVAASFVSGVAVALDRCLVAYCRKLRAAEEVSRTAGLVATAELCCGSTLRSIQRAVHAVQAAVVETRGDAALPVETRLRAANLNDRANELAVAHAHNLLLLCEDAAGSLLGQNGTTTSSKDLIWALGRAFKYLCTALLAPRVHEASILWNGLYEKGWHDDRVHKLNEKVHTIFFYGRRVTPSSKRDVDDFMDLGALAPLPPPHPHDDDDDDDDDVAMAPAAAPRPKQPRRPDFQTLFNPNAAGESPPPTAAPAPPAPSRTLHEAPAEAMTKKTSEDDDVIDMTDATPLN